MILQNDVVTGHQFSLQWNRLCSHGNSLQWNFEKNKREATQCKDFGAILVFSFLLNSSGDAHSRKSLQNTNRKHSK